MIRDLMIGGASVEDTLTLWASSLLDTKQRIRPLFTQERVAASVEQFLDGLLGDDRKTGWMRGCVAVALAPELPRLAVGCGELARRGKAVLNKSAVTKMAGVLWQLKGAFGANVGIKRGRICAPPAG